MLSMPRYLYAILPAALAGLVSCAPASPDEAAETRTAVSPASDTGAVTRSMPVSARSGSGQTSTSATLATGHVAPAAPAGPLKMTVYKNPTCECCEKWVEHLRANGFDVVVHVAEDLDKVKTDAGVPESLATCHTALVDGYVVEGHVPADVIQRLLRERPAVAGIAVPGMPRGVPGMEGPVKDTYDVMTFARNGTTSVYASR